MSTATTQAIPAGSSLAGKYLMLVLDHEAYGIAALNVREIIRLQRITPVPQMPGYVKGVINLRGRVIPVIDLRLRFGLKAEVDDRSCIIVVQIGLASGQVRPIGLIVDAVEEVANVATEDIEPPPEFGVRIDVSCLLGLVKVKGQVKILLDLDRAITSDEIAVNASVV